MDPDANVEETCRLLAISEHERPLTRDERARLRDLAEALRGWLAGGGFKPKHYEPSDSRRIRKALRTKLAA